MTKQMKILIDELKVSPQKFFAFQKELLGIAMFDELTGNIVYDDSDESKVTEILDKYFL